MTEGVIRQLYFALAIEAAQGLASALESQVQGWTVAQLRQPGAGDVAHVG